MAATDRRLRLAVVGLVVVGVVALPADRADEPMTPLPPTDRDDLELAVAARREGDGVTVALVLGVADDAEAGLPVVDWGGDEHGWSVRGTWEEGGPTRRWWTPAVQHERRPGGLLHLGPGRVDLDGILRMEPLADHVRVVDPGQEVEAEVRLDRVPPGAVRVCVWAAGAGGPGDRPAVCAEDRL